MTLKIQNNTVRVIGIITGLSALYVLFPNHWRFWIDRLFFPVQGYNVFKNEPIWVIILSFLADLILLGKLISSYGLLRLRMWAKPIAVTFLGLDFLLRLVGAINTWTFYIRNPDNLKLLAEYENKVAIAEQNGIHLKTIAVSIWPSYIIGILCILSIVILLKINFKSLSKISMYNKPLQDNGQGSGILVEDP